MKLNVKAFSLSCAILWGLSILLITLWFLIIGYQGNILKTLGNIYLGYSVSLVGAIIGLIWGFVDGLVIGAIFAWLYNKLIGNKTG